MGRVAGSRVPVITGLPETTPKDNLKALAAAGASSGGVGLFHAVGVTPEAPDLETALQGHPPEAVCSVTPDDMVRARDSLSTASDGPVAMVAVGTPHFSFDEFGRLVDLLDNRAVHPDVAFHVSTSRHVAALAAEKGWIETLEKAGVAVLVDTCTYFTPAVRGCKGRVMTNSAKWAHYAPGMLPVEVAFGSLQDCVETAVRGEVTRDPETWSQRHWGAVA